MKTWNITQQMRRLNVSDAAKTSRDSNKSGPKPKTSPKDQLFLCMSWLKNGFSLSHTVQLFKKSTISRYIITWVNLLYFSLGTIPIPIHVQSFYYRHARVLPLLTRCFSISLIVNARICLRSLPHVLCSFKLELASIVLRIYNRYKTTFKDVSILYIISFQDQPRFYVLIEAIPLNQVQLYYMPQQNGTTEPETKTFDRK